MEHKGIALVQTCGACPEQYDAIKDGVMVGYFRLRHGYFRVDAYLPETETVYEATPKGDGLFEEDEREHYLKKGLKKLHKHLKKKAKEGKTKLRKMTYL